MPPTYESRTIAAPVAQVWAALADLEAAARWNHAWRRVEYLSDQREGEGTAFRAHTEDGPAPAAPRARGRGPGGPAVPPRPRGGSLAATPRRWALARAIGGALLQRVDA